MRYEWFASFVARLHAPRYKWPRIAVGLVLVIGGVFGFLPILGFWMAPLGLSLLAVDFLWAGKLLLRLKRLVRRLRWCMAKARRRFFPRNAPPDSRA